MINSVDGRLTGSFRVGRQPRHQRCATRQLTRYAGWQPSHRYVSSRLFLTRLVGLPGTMASHCIPDASAHYFTRHDPSAHHPRLLRDKLRRWSPDGFVPTRVSANAPTLREPSAHQVRWLATVFRMRQLTAYLDTNRQLTIYSRFVISSVDGQLIGSFRVGRQLRHRRWATCQLPVSSPSTFAS